MLAEPFLPQEHLSHMNFRLSWTFASQGYGLKDMEQVQGPVADRTVGVGSVPASLRPPYHQAFDVLGAHSPVVALQDTPFQKKGRRTGPVSRRYAGSALYAEAAPRQGAVNVHARRHQVRLVPVGPGISPPGMDV